jgi:signal transduction histidine kinase
LFQNIPHKMIIITSIIHFIKYQKLKLQNHFLEMLTATVSHDLRTPLNSILGIGRGLEAHIRGDIGARYYRIMMNSTKLMQFLVNDLEDLFRIRNGNFTAYENRVNLKHHLSELMEVFFIQALEKGIGLESEYDE